MEREQLDRLLAEYATGGLSESDKKALFAAALEDQELFNQLMDEDALREAIELPGARNRLIDALQEEPVEAERFAAAGSVLQMPAAPAPAPAQAPKQGRPLGPPVWLAWAAGLGVVFVSGALTYVLFDKPPVEETAAVRSEPRKDAKPFVEPPAAPSPAAKPRSMVDEPPKIEVRSSDRVKPLPPVPLPTAPPPPMKVAEAVVPKDVTKETKLSDAVSPSKQERDKVVAENRATQQVATGLPVPSNQQQFQPGNVAPAPPALARRQAEPMVAAAPPARAAARATSETAAMGGAGPASSAKKSMDTRAPEREEKAKTVVAYGPPTIWRRSPEGVWVGVPAGEKVARTERIAIRYTPAMAQGVALVDDRGVRLAYRSGAAGEELEIPIPPAALNRATGDALALTLMEGPQAMGYVSGVVRKDTAAPPPVRILLPLR